MKGRERETEREGKSRVEILPLTLRAREKWSRSDGEETERDGVQCWVERSGLGVESEHGSNVGWLVL